MENVELAAMPERLAQRKLRGRLELHFCDGRIGSARVIEYLNRTEIETGERQPGTVQLAPHLRVQAR
jgi:hypothetical protein